MKLPVTNAHSAVFLLHAFAFRLNQKTAGFLRRDGPEDGQSAADPSVTGAGASDAGEAGGQRLGDVWRAGRQGNATKQSQRKQAAPLLLLILLIRPEPQILFKKK